MISKKKYLIFTFFFGLTLLLFPGTSYDEGVEAYRTLQLDVAESALVNALIEEPSDDRVHLLMGMVYQKQSRFEQAEEIILKGMNLYGTNRDNLAFNLANLYYSINKKDEAVEVYSEIALGQSAYRSGAILNRANCYLSMGIFANALTDYTSYLTIEPSSLQRPEIEKMIALLSQKIANEENKIQLAAQQAALDEQRRLEAEKRAAEDAAAQQALLDEILASLEDVSSETQVISAGSEDIVIDDEDSDIEE